VEGKGREKGADAPNGNGSGKYPFAGDVIKLNETNFSRWKESFQYIDLQAQLLARDVWLASDRATDDDRKNWFVSTAAFLSKKNQEANIQLSRGPEPPETARERGDAW
jgi:hypothetical protein